LGGEPTFAKHPRGAAVLVPLAEAASSRHQPHHRHEASMSGTEVLFRRNVPVSFREREAGLFVPQNEYKTNTSSAIGYLDNEEVLEENSGFGGKIFVPLFFYFSEQRANSEVVTVLCFCAAGGSQIEAVFAKHPRSEA
jgi:hypothetical protein